MSENEGGWPSRPPQRSRGFQDPAPRFQAPAPRFQAPRDGRRTEQQPGPLPPEYQPVHHEPRYDDPRRPDDSPWRRIQRVSRPEANGWYAGQPAQASYGEDPRPPVGDEFHPRDQPEFYPPEPFGDQYPRDGEYEDDYETGGRFVPGFGDDGDAEDHGGRPGRGGRRDRHQEGGGRRDGRTDGRTDRRGKAARQGGRSPKRPRRRRLLWIAPLAALLVIVVPLAVGGYYAYSFYMSKYHPADYSGEGTGYVVVQVTAGDTPTSLGPKLQKLGVVASARAFVLAAEHNSNPVGLLPGFYGMHKGMKASLAYALLINPKNLVQVTVTIPEGWRLSQIVAWLGAKSGLPASAYQNVLKNPAQLHLPAFANGKPEGYLFPATYEILPHESALGVLTGMVQRFDQEASAANLPAAAKRVHLTEGQVIIMASLVQAEGGRLSDYPKIARVIYNRLAQQIPLQLDSTVLFGLNTYGILASNQQLNSPSPYNTYRHKGLTPGPIDSPGQAAIQAVLQPASGPWLYFVTVNPKTGETLFTSSQAQFQQFREELQKNLARG